MFKQKLAFKNDVDNLEVITNSNTSRIDVLETNNTGVNTKNKKTAICL